MFYAYLYIDPRNLEPFYAGKGCGRRVTAKHTNKQFNGRLRILKELGLKPIIEIYHTKDQFAALWLEKVMVAAFGRKDLGEGTLFNHTNGGDGVTGPKPWLSSEEKKAKIRGDKNPSKRAEVREFLSKNNPAKREEVRKKISEKRKGIKRPNMYWIEKELICPHCNKVGGWAMKRWHFNNCRTIS